MSVIDATPPLPNPGSESGAGQEPPPDEPVVIEDLAAVVRIPSLQRKIRRILDRMLSSFQFPEDSPFRLVSPEPGDGVLEYGLRWRDPESGLSLFAGMSWGDGGHDPLWEVRLEAATGTDPGPLRASGLLRMAARRAESRFSEWDRFWHEDQAEAGFLIGASAACTRFLEETNPDGTAAEYLAGALHALHRSGALDAVRSAVLAPPETN
ncbi:MAG: hypothetical protein D6702_00620 [Planctomycetota bacterium]|nr:MAG: hypothetical protein D6702_00620 [Planctomycetota bacterium]